MSGLTSPFNLLPTQPEYRACWLRCRFVVNAFCTSEQLDIERIKASDRFVEDMAKQGWTLANGRVELGRGPFVVTLPGVSVPRRPERQRARLGPHERFGPTYTTPVVDAPAVETVDAWEYELVGLFYRRLLPTVLSVADAQRLEEKRRVKRHGR